MPPPSIDRNQLQKLADLARLQVAGERQPAVLQSLQRIVAAFDALRGLPTKGLEPDAESTGAAPLRTDDAEAPLPPEDVLRNAPQQAAGMFLVPRVVDA